MVWNASMQYVPQYVMEGYIGIRLSVMHLLYLPAQVVCTDFGLRSHLLTACMFLWILVWWSGIKIGPTWCGGYYKLLCGGWWRQYTVLRAGELCVCQGTDVFDRMSVRAVHWSG